MHIPTEKEAKNAVRLLIVDLKMLKKGTWVPDDVSCDASLDNLKLIKRYLEFK